MISGEYRCPLYDDDAAVTTTDFGIDQATHQLDSAVPVALSWRDRGVVRALADEVARMLAGCDRRTDTGRRDFAILTVLARLGLRRGEVAALSVDDINWHTGELVVTGKGNHRELLPLPVDVGEAIADYGFQGRQLNVIVGRTDVFDRTGPFAPGPHDLHRRRPRGRLHGAHVSHRGSLRPDLSVQISPETPTKTQVNGLQLGQQPEREPSQVKDRDSNT